MEDISVNMVLAERARQISVNGWTPEHDDEHDDGSLALAAACYAANEPIFQRRGDSFTDPWPWGDYFGVVRSADDRKEFVRHNTADKKVGKTRIRQLVIAGALILAEIERLQRLEASTT